MAEIVTTGKLKILSLISDPSEGPTGWLLRVDTGKEQRKPGGFPRPLIKLRAVSAEFAQRLIKYRGKGFLQCSRTVFHVIIDEENYLK